MNEDSACEHTAFFSPPMRLIAVVTSAALMIVFLFSVASQSLNVPILDDFPALLRFLNLVGPDGGSLPSFKLLTQQHNEHRIIFIRLIALGDMAIRDEIRFDDLMILAAIGLIAVALIIAVGAHYSIGFPAALLLTTLALLHAQPSKMLFYPMASVSAIFVMLFSLCYFLLLNSQRLSLALSAILFYILALMTMSNAVLLPAFGLIGLLLVRRPYLAIVHGLVGALGAILYFTSYRFHSGQVHTLLTEPITALQFWLGLLGSAFDPLGARDWLGMLLGLAMITFVCLLAGLRWWSKNLFVFLAICWCVFTCFVIATSRTRVYGDAVAYMALDGRYRIYSAVFLALAACTIPELTRYFRGARASLMSYVSVVAVLATLNFAAYRHYGTTNKSFVTSNLTALQKWSKDPTQAPTRPQWMPDLTKALQLKIYRPAFIPRPVD